MNPNATPDSVYAVLLRGLNGKELLVNITPQDHAFLAGLIALFCDPAQEQQLRLLREDRAALRYGKASGELYFIPNSEPDPVNPNSKN